MESAGTSGNVYQSPRSKCFLFMCTNHLDPSVFTFKCFKCFHNVYQCHVDSKSFYYLFILIIDVLFMSCHDLLIIL